MGRPPMPNDDEQSRPAMNLNCDVSSSFSSSGIFCLLARSQLSRQACSLECLLTRCGAPLLVP